MKKIFYSIITAVLALSACQKVDFKPQDSDKVDIRFDVKMPAGNWGTKALAENPDLKSLHVALFDENGYKVDMTEAELISINNTDRTYTYSIRVTSTDEPRIMHFLGNCPATKAAEIADSYGNEMTLLTDIVCENEQDAYWQKKLLSKGIPSDPGAAKNEIGPVELVRNYAKLSVVSTAPLFELDGIVVYNVPDKGFLAPYINSGSNAGKFVEDYNGKSYEQVTALYPGYIPAGANLRTHDASDQLTKVGTDGVASAFMYETPASSATPFIIVGGTFKGATETRSEGTYCYYKVNLKDINGKDYALLRNYNFKVNIVGVTRIGEASIADAIESVGSGDISTLSSFENATNISDTQSQLFISETAVTVVKQSTITIKYKYIPDVESSASVHNNNVKSSATDSSKPIEIELGEAGEFGAAIASYSVASSDDSTDGYRVITINTTAQDGTFKEQRLTIKGHGRLANGNYEGNIVTRTVTIAVRPTFKLTADCPLIVEGAAGEALPLTIGVESDIPESIFPVNLSIEATAMTLAPASTENLPVSTGKSITGSGKPAYQFVKNLSYAEYTAAKADAFQKDGITYYPIVCNFITNVANSSSEIYVDSELFNMAQCEFALAKHYTEVQFSEAMVGSGQTVTLSFKAEDTKPVTITLVGAIKGGSNVVTIIPSAAGAKQTVDGLTTTSYGKGVTATLTNPSYATATVTRYRSAVLQEGALNSSNLPAAPCAFSDTNLSDNFNMTVGASSVAFSAGRVVESQITVPALSGSASGGRKNYEVVITNYDASLIYEYSTNQNSGYTEITPASVSGATATFNISFSGNTTTFYISARRGTLRVRATVSYNWIGDNSFTSQAAASSYVYGNYSLTGPNANTTVTFTEDVTADTVVPMSYTYGGKTATCNSMTVDQIVTGTVGEVTFTLQ